MVVLVVVFDGVSVLEAHVADCADKVRDPEMCVFMLPELILLVEAFAAMLTFEPAKKQYCYRYSKSIF